MDTYEKRVQFLILQVRLGKITPEDMPEPWREAVEAATAAE